MAAAGSAWASAGAWAAAEIAPAPEADFAAVLRGTGIWEVAPELGLDPDQVFLPLARQHRPMAASELAEDVASLERYLDDCVHNVDQELGFQRAS